MRLQQIVKPHARERLRELAPHLLRVAVGLVFVMAGASKLLAPVETSAVLADHGIPWPNMTGTALGTFEIVMGSLLVANRFARSVSTLLAAHVLILSLAFHFPFGLPAGVGQARAVALMFDLFAIAALYAIAMQRDRRLPPSM